MSVLPACIGRSAASSGHDPTSRSYFRKPGGLRCVRWSRRGNGSVRGLLSSRQPQANCRFWTLDTRLRETRVVGTACQGLLNRLPASRREWTAAVHPDGRKPFRAFVFDTELVDEVVNVSGRL